MLAGAGHTGAPEHSHRAQTRLRDPSRLSKAATFTLKLQPGLFMMTMPPYYSHGCKLSIDFPISWSLKQACCEVPGQLAHVHCRVFQQHDQYEQLKLETFETSLSAWVNSLQMCQHSAGMVNMKHPRYDVLIIKG